MVKERRKKRCTGERMMDKDLFLSIWFKVSSWICFFLAGFNAYDVIFDSGGLFSLFFCIVFFIGGVFNFEAYEAGVKWNEFFGAEQK